MPRVAGNISLTHGLAESRQCRRQASRHKFTSASTAGCGRLFNGTAPGPPVSLSVCQEVAPRARAGAAGGCLADCRVAVTVITLTADREPRGAVTGTVTQPTETEDSGDV